MQPKFKKKLQLARETVRSLVILGPSEMQKVAGGISRATLCDSKDLDCTGGGGSGGVTCNTVDSNCPSAGDTACGC
jgi:hypothetical protein